MPRRQEALNAVLGGAQDGVDRRRHLHVRDEQREVVQTHRFGLDGAHRVGGRCRLETDGEEDHLPVRILLRQPHGIERRVDDADVATGCPNREQITARAWDAQHIAVRGEDHLGPLRDGKRFINKLERRDADRAAWTMDQFDFIREQLIDTVPDDRMGLTAADFH